MASLPLTEIRFERDHLIRDAIDLTRVDDFCRQMQEGEGFPPVEVVPQAGGKYLLGDGVHRCLAAQRAGHPEIDALIVIPRPNESPLECAYRTALETAARGPLALTNAERRRAAIHLLESQPQMSRRAIAQLVGAAHSSVNRWAVEAEPPSDNGPRQRIVIGPSPSQVAMRLVRNLGRISDSRGVFDLLAPRRMGRHMADAFADHFGDSALDEAQRFHAWMAAAVTALEDGAG